MNRTRLDQDRFVVPRECRDQGVDVKPLGLWYSVDGGWEDWCASEMPEWLKDRHLHKIVLDGEKILQIRTAKGIGEFHEKYRAGGDVPIIRDYIDWGKVADDYDGIEIAPYQWAHRFMTNASRWYYGWDCASGCVWRPKGMQVVFMREKEPSVKEE